MLRRQTIIALGIAIFLGLLAVYFANVFLNARERAVATAPDGSIKVAVAAVPLDFGVELTPDKVRFIPYPASALPVGSYQAISTLLPAGKPRMALRPIAMNEPILASKISGEGQRASIAALLPPGKRAAAVRIDDVSGVAGFIQPNDSVDVLVTRQVPGNDSDRQMTDILLQNARVIAIDQDAKGANGKAVIAKTATIEVTPVEAQKLALAQQVGTLSLVLRRPGMEQDNPIVTTVSLNDLRYNLYGRPTGFALTRPVVAAPRARSIHKAARQPASRLTPPPATNSVEVIRGTTNTSYEVGGQSG